MVINLANLVEEFLVGNFFGGNIFLFEAHGFESGSGGQFIGFVDIGQVWAFGFLHDRNAKS